MWVSSDTRWFFFFKQKTAYEMRISDWSSDVCSSDLPVTGDELEGEASGELLVRGPSVFPGYFRDPELSAVTLRGGWLHTGDLVHRDAQGYFRVIEDRKSVV